MKCITWKQILDAYVYLLAYHEFDIFIFYPTHIITNSERTSNLTEKRAQLEMDVKQTKREQRHQVEATQVLENQFICSRKYFECTFSSLLLILMHIFAYHVS
jgi:Na+(H+)/acetate symporter ActP